CQAGRPAGAWDPRSRRAESGPSHPLRGRLVRRDALEPRRKALRLLEAGEPEALDLLAGRIEEDDGGKAADRVPLAKVLDRSGALVREVRAQEDEALGCLADLRIGEGLV